MLGGDDDGTPVLGDSEGGNEEGALVLGFAEGRSVGCRRVRRMKNRCEQRGEITV